MTPFKKVREAIVRTASTVGLDAAKVDRNLPSQSRWLKRPRFLGKETCLLVTLASEVGISEHAIVYAEALREHGLSVVVIIVAEDLGIPNIDQLANMQGVLLRENRGYDFGAWADGIRLLRHQLKNVDLLVIANDSVFGPFSGFSDILTEVRSSSADLVALTESFERVHHFQSFMLFFKKGALRANAFWKFWRGVRQADREWVISCYELTVRDKMIAAGLSTAVLYESTSGSRNPTLWRWRELIDKGFPFIKTSLLRDNAYGLNLSEWPDVVAQAGYDPAIIERFFSTRGIAMRLKGK